MINIYDLFPIELSKYVFSEFGIIIASIAIFWMILASIQDFKKREVENWWNFGLIVFILGFRAFFSIQNSEYMYFIWGLIGLSAGFILANAFYYARMFAGGDAKLLMALGAVLPLTLDWRANLGIVVLFLFLFIFFGSIYGTIYSVILAGLNFSTFKKEYYRWTNKYIKNIYYYETIIILFALVFILTKFYIGAIMSGILFLAPWLFIYAKAVEESSMNKIKRVRDLTVGDWLIHSIKIGKKIIKPNWEGITEMDLKLIQKKLKNKRVTIKEGIPFVPAFLIAFLALGGIIYYFKL